MVLSGHMRLVIGYDDGGVLESYRSNEMFETKSPLLLVEAKRTEK